MAKKEFTRKPYSWGLYKWSPIDADVDKSKPQGERRLNSKGRERFCNANPYNGVQGEDWFVTYVYKETTDSNGVNHRYAYVDCGYVE